MKTLNNQIFVQRGETFSIDRAIENKDGSPYVICSEINNPYFLLTVTSTRYEQEDRYMLRKWIDLSTVPRFKQTKIVDLRDYNKTFDDITEVTTYEEYENVLFYVTEGDKLILYQVGDAVFTDGESYKYWDPNKTENGWTDYKCRFVVMFSSSITKNWVEQNYCYSINLVGGESSENVLREICDNNDILYTSDKTSLKKLLDDLNIEYDKSLFKRPLINISADIVVLKPTKLTVSSNLQGGNQYGD